MRRLLTSLTLAGLAFLVTLLTVEILLRVFSEQLPPAVASSAGITTTSNIGVERFRRAWLGSLMADDERGMRTAGNLDVQLDGHPDFSFHLRTNADGFRNRYSAGPVDIVAIGDSFTFGYGVDEDEAWPALLEEMSGQSVANLGQTNYGPQAELKVLERDGLPLQPKTVIWQFFANDFLDASSFQEWQRSGKQDVFQLEAQRLAEERSVSAAGEPLLGLRGFLHRNLVSYELIKYVLGVGSYRVTRSQQVPVRVAGARMFLNRSQLDGWSDLEWPAILEGRALTESVLLAAHDRSQSVGTSILVVLVPSKEEVYAGALGNAAREDPWNRPRNSQLIADYCRQRQLRCLDTFEAFERAVEGGAIPYFSHDGHLNEEGNRVLARAIAGYLASDME